nr:zinc finger protein 414 [Pogona vitticeps]
MEILIILFFSRPQEPVDGGKKKEKRGGGGGNSSGELEAALPREIPALLLVESNPRKFKSLQHVLGLGKRGVGRGKGLLCKQSGELRGILRAPGLTGFLSFSSPFFLPPGEDASPGAPPAASATTASLGSCHPPPRRPLGAPLTHIGGTAEEKEAPPMATSPRSSLSGSNNSGLLNTQPQPKLSAGGGNRNQALRILKRRPAPGKRYQCSGDGCRLACRSMKELLDHMRLHYRPTQSLEGKTFHCSTLGCAESFPNMQSLMGHMKAHYKLNRYFKCENCTSRFRTHRSLFKHLHSCSDPATATPPPPPALAADKPVFLPASSSQSLFGPPVLPRFSTPPAPSVPGPFLPYMQPPNYALPQAAVQNRLRPFLPGQSLPVSNAVWKKSQGHSSNSRIVWEHTRGRYNCLQCPYSTASREEMTQHTEDHRKNPSPPGRLDGEMEFGVALPTFHPKLTPDVENTLFTPL